MDDRREGADPGEKKSVKPKIPEDQHMKDARYRAIDQGEKGVK
jgi:hypothetical protein